MNHTKHSGKERSHGRFTTTTASPCQGHKLCTTESNTVSGNISTDDLSGTLNSERAAGQLLC